MTASSNGGGAGIGGAKYSNCRNIVIESGTITATGGDYAAGMGGACYGRPDNIDINITRAIYDNSISVEIKVEWKQVFYESKCSAHSRYDWEIYVKTCKTSNYLVTPQKMYARKPSGSWTCVFAGATQGDAEWRNYYGHTQSKRQNLACSRSNCNYQQRNYQQR